MIRSWIRKEGVYSRASRKQDLSQVSKLTLNHASATRPSNCMRETALEPHYNLEEDLRQIPAEGHPVQYLIGALQYGQGHPLGESAERSQPGGMYYPERVPGAGEDIKGHQTCCIHLNKRALLM